MTTEKITEMLKNFLMGPFYSIGNGIWSFVMDLICGVATTTPQDFSSNAWQYISTQIYPWTLAIGVLLLNLFFLAGFLKQTANIKENMTTEIAITLLVKLVMVNTIMVSGLNIMQEFFSMASGLSAQILAAPPAYAPADIDLGLWLFFSGIYGILYMIVALVSSVTIFLAVYGRYLKLYLTVVCGPIALSTGAGGLGIENTAHAWVKTFLAYTFEIVVIALTISLAGKMISGIDWGKLDGFVGTLFNGATTSIQAMFTMIILAGSVKGTDSFMRRTFGL